MQRTAQSTLFILLCLLAGTASAQGPDLDRCIYPSTGIPMDPRVCESLRANQLKREQDEAEKARVRAAEDAQRAELAATQEASANAARDKRQAADAAKYKIESDARAAAWQAQRDREDAEEARLAAARTTRMKECGTDFGRPRVGMTITRAQRCVGDFKLQGELDAPGGGVVQTYVAGHTVLHVAGGTIKAWNRY